MTNVFEKLKRSFEGVGKRGERMSFSDIRPSKCVYFLAYALELIFYALRGQFLPIGFNPFGFSGLTIVQALHMVASLVVMLLWSEKFEKLLRGSAAVMLLGFIPFLFLPRGLIRFIFGAIGFIGLGGVVTGARCGYAFACNNTERLFGMVLTFFTVMLVRVAGSLGFSNVLTEYILPILLLGALAFCVFKFKECDLEVKTETTKADARGLYWAFAFFIMYFVVDGYIARLVDGDLVLPYMHYAFGILVSCIIFVVAFLVLRLNTWHLWNFFFLCIVGMGTFAYLAPTLMTFNYQYFFCGLSYLGWPLCIYTMGCAQRRFASYALLKRCTIVYVILSPLTTFSSSFALSKFPMQFTLISLVVMLAITIFMLMLSPLSYKHLFSALWAKDIYKTDMELVREKVDKADKLGEYGLTPRQKEVATLLLLAKTRRQISGELGISESTVKMHVSDLYRKLNINSRTELFRLFGVPEIEDIAAED